MCDNLAYLMRVSSIRVGKILPVAFVVFVSIRIKCHFTTEETDKASYLFSVFSEMPVCVF